MMLFQLIIDLENNGISFYSDYKEKKTWKAFLVISSPDCQIQQMQVHKNEFHESTTYNDEQHMLLHLINVWCKLIFFCECIIIIGNDMVCNCVNIQNVLELAIFLDSVTKHYNRLTVNIKIQLIQELNTLLNNSNLI